MFIGNIYLPIFAKEREKDHESKALPIGQKFCNEVFHRYNWLSFMYSTCSSKIVNPVFRTFQSSRVTNRLRSDAGLTVLKTTKTCNYFVLADNLTWEIYGLSIPFQDII